MSKINYFLFKKRIILAKKSNIVQTIIDYGTYYKIPCIMHCIFWLLLPIIN